MENPRTMQLSRNITTFYFHIVKISLRRKLSVKFNSIQMGSINRIRNVLGVTNSLLIRINFLEGLVIIVISLNQAVRCERYYTWVVKSKGYGDDFGIIGASTLSEILLRYQPKLLIKKYFWKTTISRERTLWKRKSEK
jgi:hypothetical protein